MTSKHTRILKIAKKHLAASNEWYEARELFLYRNFKVKLKSNFKNLYDAIKHDEDLIIMLYCSKFCDEVMNT